MSLHMNLCIHGLQTHGLCLAISMTVLVRVITLPNQHHLFNESESGRPKWLTDNFVKLQI